MSRLPCQAHKAEEQEREARGFGPALSLCRAIENGWRRAALRPILGHDRSRLVREGPR